MKKFTAVWAMMAIVSMPALGATPPAKPKAVQCRDAHGKFIKCAPKATTKKTPCRDAKGKFVKCK